MNADLQQLSGSLATLTSRLVTLEASIKAQSRSWNQLIVLPMISCAATDIPWDWSDIDPDGTDGMVDCLNNGTTKFEAESFSTNGFPNLIRGTGGLYGTGLLPLADMDEITKPTNEVMIKSAFFTAIDPIYNDSSATYQALIDALSTDRPYAMTDFRFGQLPMFQPNFFRPWIMVKGKPFWGENMQRSQLANPVGGAKNHFGHLTMGIPNPYLTDNVNIVLPPLNKDDLVVSAFAGQMVGTKVQRYPVYACLEFLVRPRQ